ncbi:MAG TPA: hypothetical protein VF173_16485 [Thermoanaerobaculia bacterium]|nr:hypothetical protein [Thermoanaerobaculia bacterium]
MASRGERGECHPSVAELESFLLGEMPPSRMTPIITHLLRGCDQCRQEMVPLASMLLTGGKSAPERVAGSGAEYDFALFKAFSTARRFANSLASKLGEPREPRPFPKEVPAPHQAAAPASNPRQRCEALFELCHTLRASDLEGMLLAASLAVQLAERLDPSSETSDLQALAWAELGNAQRVADHLQQAEIALAKAVRKAGEGTGEPRLLAKLMDLTASLYTDQRRFEDARRLLDWVYVIQEHLGDFHAAGRARISQGTSAYYALEPLRGVEHLAEGLRKIDSSRDPKLAMAAIHNLLWCLVDCGRIAEVQALLPQCHQLCSLAGGPLDKLKVRWLAGRIAAHLGDDQEAERAFRRVREGLEESDLPYDVALASLDLAALWLRQGRTAELRQLVNELVAIFRAQRIQREALGALLLLKDAIQKDQATASLLQRVTTELRRMERLPSLKAPASL